MSLYQYTVGSGCAVVALHGWGLDSGVWIETQQALSERFRVTRLDLPGYGGSRESRVPWQIEPIAEAVADAITVPSVLMGWSLGGMVALMAAKCYPDKVCALVLVASTPCFVRKPDWPYGLPEALLETFARDLAADGPATVGRFLTLQAGQSEGARLVIKRLRKALREGGIPAPAVVRDGLAVLRDVDLRPLLGTLRCPALMVLGGRDVLVPPTVLPAMSRLRPDWGVAILANSGHAPFISHQTAFLERVQVFLDEVC